MVKYEIEWEILNENNDRINNGTDFVEGKSEKDAVKNWLYKHTKDILHKSFFDNWEGRSFKIIHIDKAVIVKQRPKSVIK